MSAGSGTGLAPLGQPEKNRPIPEESAGVDFDEMTSLDSATSTTAAGHTSQAEQGQGTGSGDVVDLKGNVVQTDKGR